MTKSTKIIFFGTDESVSLVALRALIKAGYNIAAVVTKPDSKSGRGQKITPPVVKTEALKHGIPVWQPAKISDISDDIKKLGTGSIGVLASFGKIIPEAIINLFDHGIVNVHPSLLPIYRGPTPIESAIANGDKQTGVSIMGLSASMDAGPIYSQITYELTGNETQPELYRALADLGAAELIKMLPGIIDGSVTAAPQDDTKSTYCNLLNKQDALVDLSKMTAAAAERLVRAHLVFPKTKLTISDQQITITAASISDQPKSDIDIPCYDNKYLSIDKLIAPSGKTMDAKSFINGYKL